MWRLLRYSNYGIWQPPVSGLGSANIKTIQRVRHGAASIVSCYGSTLPSLRNMHLVSKPRFLVSVLSWWLLSAGQTDVFSEPYLASVSPVWPVKNYETRSRTAVFRVEAYSVQSYMGHPFCWRITEGWRRILVIGLPGGRQGVLAMAHMLQCCSERESSGDAAHLPLQAPPGCGRCLKSLIQLEVLQAKRTWILCKDRSRGQKTVLKKRTLCPTRLTCGWVLV